MALAGATPPESQGILRKLVRHLKKPLLILFGLITTTVLVVRSVNFQLMIVWLQQWLLPCGLILLGVFTAFVYLWWGSDKLATEQSTKLGSSTFGGFLSGMFLALGLSLCYHYQFLDDPYSLGWLLLLWIVLSSGLWRLKTRQGVMHLTTNQLRRDKRNFSSTGKNLHIVLESLCTVGEVHGEQFHVSLPIITIFVGR